VSGPGAPGTGPLPGLEGSRRRSAALEARLRELEPPRRARSPLLAAVALAAVAWFAWDLWPDVRWFLSSRTPIDLGDARAPRPAEARPNRLARVAGPLVGSVGGTAGGRDARRVSGVLGTNVVVDRPAGAPPAAAFEGRLLPPARAAGYEPFVAELRRQGWSPGDGYVVLREGERPGDAGGRAALALLLAGLAALNLRTLLRRRAA
jgi:hypothetical protein